MIDLFFVALVVVIAFIALLTVAIWTYTIVPENPKDTYQGGLGTGYLSTPSDSSSYPPYVDTHASFPYTTIGDSILPDCGPDACSYDSGSSSGCDSSSGSCGD